MITRPATGFQKSQVQALLRAEEREAQKAEITPLNPAFPYTVESYDPDFFGLPANPQPLAK